MRVTLLYADTNYSSYFKDLRAGQCAAFGSGARADFGVSGPGVGEVHFQIENDGHRVEVRRVGSMPCPVTVNGDATTAAELEDGDVVGAGNTQVKVRIARAAPAEEAAEAAAAEAKRCVVTAEALPTGLSRWADPEQEVPLGEAVDRLVGKFPALQMANFLLAGETRPDWLAEDADLLAEMPGGVAAEHSLHLIAAEDIPLASIEPALPGESSHPPQLSALLGLFDKLRSKSAASLLFGDATKDDVLEAIKFHRGFFSTAKGLEMFLKQGSPDLAQKLVGASTAILVAGAGKLGWAIYASPDAIGSAAELGFDDEEQEEPQSDE